MIEYLHNAIRAMGGADFVIEAKITDDAGIAITSGCKLIIHVPDETMLTAIEGECVADVWRFVVPAEITRGLVGRHWYCIQHEGKPLCFKEPLYLV